MTQETGTILRVGMVGANPDTGWGSGVHRRAIGYLPGYRLHGVCTTRKESAERASVEFGAPLAFTDYRDLVAHDEIDVVAICVKAPFHYDITKAALLAGKHVYCEWPLAMTVEQARELAGLANAGQAKAVIGLHQQGSPVHRYAAHLIKEGFLGEVYSVNLHVRVYGPMSRPMAVRSGGTTLLTIYGGHLLDAVDHHFGGIASLEAHSVIHLPPVDETGAPVDRDAPDHLLFNGTMANGALFSVDLGGASVAGLGSVWRIDGTQGSLVLSSRDPALHAMEPLVLSGARVGEAMQPMPIPAEFDNAFVPATPDRYSAYQGMDASREAVVSVANLYAGLHDAVVGGGTPSPDFNRAVRVQSLVASVDQTPVRSSLNSD